MKKSKLQLICILLCLFLSNVTFANTAKTGMRNITSMNIVYDMGIGWNLGNTLDAEGPNEMYWGNPMTTKAFVDEVAAKGFKTFRLPVTWRFHIGDAPEYKVEDAWMDRVEEVANYAFANDMYVIVNVHHDDPWIIPTNDKKDEVKDKLEKLWTQIAERFKDYGDYLIFETLNEPRYEGSAEEWTGGTEEGRQVVNEYHQISVDAIRATGSNNTTRHLMVSTYAASTNSTAMNDLIIPNDDPNIIVSLHSYFPYLFCLGDETEWGTDADKNALDQEFDRIYNKFVKNGIPVVLGEWCETDNDNLEARIAHAKYYARGAIERGFCPILWDIGTSGLLDRNTYQWKWTGYAEAILEALDYRKTPCPDVEFNPIVQINQQTVADINKNKISIGDDIKISINPNIAGTIEWELADGSTVSTEDLIINEIKDNQVGNITMIYSGKDNCQSKLIFGFSLDVYEAENWLNQSGIQSETTADINGNENIGFIENNDWSSYEIDIPTTGLYKVSARVATGSTGGNIEFSIADQNLGTLDVEFTQSGDWQEWYTTDFIEMNLPEGKSELKLTYTGGVGYLFNVNWFNIVSSQGNTTSDQNYILNFPTNNYNISFNNQSQIINILNLNFETAELLDIQGKLVSSLKTGENNISYITPGIYYVVIKSHNVIIDNISFLKSK